MLRSIIEDQHNLLVHCSDGWDRTSQMCALTALMLDPFYRTFDGFQVLIEKDFLAFGHMFGKRCGHLNMREKDARSPVFIQFLDCVHQIWHQMPCQFEFNDELLVFLAYHSYSCKYGTFLLNCDQERVLKRLRDETISVWLEVNLRRLKDFKNPYYDPSSNKLERVTQVRTTEHYKLRVWREYFFQHTSSPEEDSDGEK